MHEDHKVIEKYEKIWFYIGLVMIGVFLILVLSTVVSHGNTIPTELHSSEDHQKLLAEFNNPRVEFKNNEYTVWSLSSAFMFEPLEVKVKKGKKVTFYLTSKDVQHGFQIEGTNINVQVIPGQIGTVSHTFKTAGRFLIICNEYCGAGHQSMISHIVVEE